MFPREIIRRGFLWWIWLISQSCYPQLVGIDRSERLFPPDVLNLFGRSFRKPEARRRLAGCVYVMAEMGLTYVICLLFQNALTLAISALIAAGGVWGFPEGELA